ncbi:MAG: hypothetical protein Q8Q28_03125 [Pseudomonadota bacterium]|nr:hypothetical protein [Pseudomonadota bacterium]
MEKADLIKQVIALCEDDRCRLVEALLDNLSPSDPGIDPARLEDMKCRFAAYCADRLVNPEVTGEPQ